MRHQFALADSPVPALPRRNGAAIEQLLHNFNSGRALTLLSGTAVDVAQLAVDAFLQRVTEDHDIIRLSEPSADPLTCMSGIIQAMGFETDGLELRDLKQVLRMFLSYQHTHRRRTILCVEGAQNASGWTLNLLDELVQQELEDRYGLFVVLSGDGSLAAAVRQPSLDSLSTQAGSTIHIAPFDLDETRVYINRYVEANGYGPLADLFEFDAVTRVHELSEGVPDTINQLLLVCLNSRNSRRDSPVSPAQVAQAAGAIAPSVSSGEQKFELVPEPSGGQLVARFRGEEVLQRRIDEAKLLIGRKRRCDIRLRGKSISREHAMLLWIEAGVRIVDLGSTNGTFVDGRFADNSLLDSGDVIQLGDYEITFTAPE